MSTAYRPAKPAGPQSHPEANAGEPPRARGRRTRALILERAAELFAARGDDAVSVAEIAAAAGAHPNQITYYFTSKDGLFVHAAFRLLLRDAARLEPLGRRQRTPESFRLVLARAALALPTVPLAVRAMSIAGRRPELRPVAEHNLAILFRQADRYLAGVLHRRGWVVDRTPEAETRTFWSTVLGARLISESGFGGRSDDIDLAGVLTIRSPDVSADVSPDH